MKQDTGGTVTLQAATSGTATATVPAIAGVVSVELKGADIASATTTDLSTATGDFVDVTGTTTITGLGTLAAGIERTVRFTGALTLTHNATSLILPGAANITTAANDRAIFRSLGSGNWLCVSYNKASGAAVVSGGLTNFTESTGTYSTQTYVRLIATNAATDVNAIFSPKGTGYISAQLPDGTATGGNQRGSRAIDLQLQRGAADRVASGTRSCVIGGYGNKASGFDSIAIAGNYNTVTAKQAIVGGANCTASGPYAVCFGFSSTASGYYSVAIGKYCTADFYGSVAFGKSSNCRGTSCFAFSSGAFSASGGAQVRAYVLRKQTTDNTAGQAITTDGNAASSTNQVVLKNNSCITFRALISVVRTDATSGWTNRSSWVAQGAAARDANAASTIVTTVTPTVISNTPGYTLAVDADTTNGCLRFKATGATGHTLNWVVHVEISESTTT